MDSSTTQTTLPTLPAIPSLDPILIHTPPFLRLPPEIRKLIYDALTPEGYLITITLEAKNPFSEWLSLFLLHPLITSELKSHLSTLPITLHCPTKNRPTVLHRLPPNLLRNTATIIISESSPSTPLTPPLYPSLQNLVFARTLESHIIPPPQTNFLEDLQSHLQLTVPSTLHPMHPDLRAALHPIPPTNALLSSAHQFWKDLRISHAWVRRLCSPSPSLSMNTSINILLHTTMELHVPTLPAPPPNHTGSDPAPTCLDSRVTFRYHYVVDVATQRVLERGYLGSYRSGGPGGEREKWVDEEVFPYGRVWWLRRR